VSALDLVRSFGKDLVRWEPEIRPEILRWGDPMFQAWADAYLKFQGGIYQPAYSTTYAGEKVERPVDSFQGYVGGAYKSNGVIFAVSMARARPFSEIAFKFRRRNQSGGGNDLYGNQSLSVLESPWPGGTTQSLLLRAEQDVTAGGTFFVAREQDRQGRDRLRRLRPDWTEFILSAPPDQAVEADIVGYRYVPGGLLSGNTPRYYLLDECAHWAPIPDPEALYRGMSWLTPVIKEMMGDQAATEHKLKFFENAATPNLAVSISEKVPYDEYEKFARKMNEMYGGVENAYKTLYTGGGADVRVIGADMQQLDFRATQGAGETRIAAAGGVPPIVVGLSEGLSSATYSNYGQAKRAYADLFLRSQWRSLCGAISPLIDIPVDSTLWYDSRDVAFLREDAKDLAEVQSITMATINAALASGWTPESAKKAVLAEDLDLLQHSGLMSVQLQPPGAGEEKDPEAEAREVVSSKVGDIAALAGSPFEPESIVTAVDTGDLTKLVLAEPEEPDPESVNGDLTVEDDPEADPAADDATAAALEGLDI
jgi:phage portal protein BeeE